jgi:hypothetical protein
MTSANYKYIVTTLFLSTTAGCATKGELPARDALSERTITVAAIATDE